MKTLCLLEAVYWIVGTDDHGAAAAWTVAYIILTCLPKEAP